MEGFAGWFVPVIASKLITRCFHERVQQAERRNINELSHWTGTGMADAAQHRSSFGTRKPR